MTTPKHTPERMAARFLQVVPVVADAAARAGTTHHSVSLDAASWSYGQLTIYGRLGDVIDSLAFAPMADDESPAAFGERLLTLAAATKERRREELRAKLAALGA